MQPIAEKRLCKFRCMPLATVMRQLHTDQQVHFHCQHGTATGTGIAANAINSFITIEVLYLAFLSRAFDKASKDAIVRQWANAAEGAVRAL